MRRRITTGEARVTALLCTALAASILRPRGGLAAADDGYLFERLALFT